MSEKSQENGEAKDGNVTTQQRIAVRVTDKETLRGLMGQSPEKYYDACAALITDTCQLCVFDHSQKGLEAHLYEGEYLNRKTLPVGACVQGVHLVMGTPEGDYVFKDVKIVVGVVAQSETNILAITAVMTNFNAEPAEYLNFSKAMEYKQAEQLEQGRADD